MKNWFNITLELKKKIDIDIEFYTIESSSKFNLIKLLNFNFDWSCDMIIKFVILKY